MDNKAYEEIKHNGKVIAIIVRSDYTSDNIVFFSPPDFSQQLGYLSHRKGSIIKSHIHRKIDRKVTLTQEVLFIKKGRILVKQESIESRPIISGNLLYQPFLKHYYNSYDFPNADFLHVNGMYVGNNQFVNDERLAYLHNLLDVFLG